jgi:hypothetical protein
MGRKRAFTCTGSENLVEPERRDQFTETFIYVSLRALVRQSFILNKYLRKKYPDLQVAVYAKINLFKRIRIAVKIHSIYSLPTPLRINCIFDEFYLRRNEVQNCILYVAEFIAEFYLRHSTVQNCIYC